MGRGLAEPLYCHGNAAMGRSSSACRAEFSARMRTLSSNAAAVPPPPPSHPVCCTQDARVNWICNPVHKHRELRGLTSAGKKYRGLRGKGSRYTKNAPSKRATWLKHNSPSLRRYR